MDENDSVEITVDPPVYEKGPTGRPPKPVDWIRVELLLMCGCNGPEIAANFDMHVDTFYQKVKNEFGINFTTYASLFKQKGDSLLREKQFEKALEKDNTMMIWLGKQRLHQKEPEQQKSETTQTESVHVIIAQAKELSDDGNSKSEPSALPQRGDGED